MTDSTLTLVASALATAIREGEVSDFKSAMRWSAEYLGTYMVPEADYLKPEELDVFSVVVGMTMGMACNELVKGEESR